MKYQLVLQTFGSSIEDYDTMIEIESILTDSLEVDCEVDGHDLGSGESNIFINTDNPVGTYDKIRAILGKQYSWANTRVAYREIMLDDYIILWPLDLKKFEIV